MVSFPVLVVPTSHLVVPTSHLVVLFTYFGRPFYIGSLLVLCTRNFIATPNLKKRSNDTLSLTRLSACLHLTWSSTEPGIFGAVGFCDSKRRSRVGCTNNKKKKTLFSVPKLYAYLPMVGVLTMRLICGVFEVPTRTIGNILVPFSLNLMKKLLTHNQLLTLLIFIQQSILIFWVCEFPRKTGMGVLLAFSSNYQNTLVQWSLRMQSW